MGTSHNKPPQKHALIQLFHKAAGFLLPLQKPSSVYLAECKKVLAYAISDVVTGLAF
ncbi:hypothetical protein Mucpa_3564 [Mucilaginibacter paludis DSM 18603]|uniref:Uncharacterized protein n=1 Tax=Mucilaginibacter paludis DSM 18603 TaxID=714943 RepID=H1YIW7_9SPHI|nr:hypothetical protein Mucpa_3564 [Mucilaginibacter paludis DSM 18603]